GEAGVARQKRPVEVRADRAPDATAFVAALAVVAETGDDAPEGLRAGVEPRPARVVLEPGERSHDPGLELALEQHVADHARVARDGLQREEADAREVGAA